MWGDNNKSSVLVPASALALWLTKREYCNQWATQGHACKDLWHKIEETCNALVAVALSVMSQTPVAAVPCSGHYKY